MAIMYDTEQMRELCSQAAIAAGWSPPDRTRESMMHWYKRFPPDLGDVHRHRSVVDLCIVEHLGPFAGKGDAK